MNNLSKRLETICLMPDVNTIVDAVAILNKHIKLNESVEIAPIMDELRGIPVLKKQSHQNLKDVLKTILKARGLQCEFKKTVIEKDNKKGAYPAIVVSKLETKELPKQAKITIKIKHYD